MKHIEVMIATDGSDAAIEAANRAVALLHPDARITLVTVIDARHDPMEDAGGFEGPVMTDEEADHEWQQSVAGGREAIARTEAAFAGRVADEAVIPTGAGVDRALRELVEAQQPDLLVLGSEQPNWFQRFLHGSLEDRMLHHAPCPLLIVGHHQADGEADA
jgi:nucleotide-binding universal stress UspA family protein